MLPKAHLTSHSRMSGSRSVIIPSWLSGSWRSFLYSSSVYSYHFFCFCFYISVLNCAHLFIKCSLGVSNFLEEISSLSLSVVFLYFFALELRKAFLSLLAILWNSAFRCLHLSFPPLLFTSFLFTAICKASPDSHFAFFEFLFYGDCLDPCLLYNVTNLSP